MFTDTTTTACAFFDVDQTIWSEKSVISFWEYYLRRNHPKTHEEQLKSFRSQASTLIEKGTSREDLNAWFYQTFFKGLPVSEISEAAISWCDQHFQKSGFWNQPILDRIAFHQSQGHSIVLVSGSFKEILEPLAKRIGASAILGAPLETAKDRFTGKMLSIPMIGYGKAKAVMRYLHDKNIPPENSYGYGDDVSDIPFISVLGNPYLVIRPEDSDMSTVSSIIKYKTISV